METLCNGSGSSIENTCQKHDGDTGFESATDAVASPQRANCFEAKATATDEAGDHDHCKYEHDRLVDRGHDLRTGERKLDLGQALPTGCSE